MSLQLRPERLNQPLNLLTRLNRFVRVIEERANRGATQVRILIELMVTDLMKNSSFLGNNRDPHVASQVQKTASRERSR